MRALGFSVLSWNAFFSPHFWEKRMMSILEECGNHRPDIICLQVRKTSNQDCEASSSYLSIRIPMLIGSAARVYTFAETLHLGKRVVGRLRRVAACNFSHHRSRLYHRWRIIWYLVQIQETWLLMESSSWHVESSIHVSLTSIISLSCSFDHSVSIPPCVSVAQLSDMSSYPHKCIVSS